jgi:hypothetical protein
MRYLRSPFAAGPTDGTSIHATRKEIRMRTSTVLLLTTFALATLGGCPQPGNGTGNGNGDDPNFTLADGFGVLERSGTTTTTDDSPSCAGFFPESPNHVMTLSETITDMTVAVASTEADVVLYIRFGGSTFCGSSDDPQVNRGSWSAGQYEIFVGTVAAAQNVSYTLTVSE